MTSRFERSGPTPRPNILALAPYVPGRPIADVSREHGIADVVKLASNENPLGPSPKAIEAAARVLAGVNRYPDGAGTELREAIARRHDLSPERVILGAGGSELIDLVVRSYVDPGEEIVVPEGIFRMFAVSAQRANASFIEVPTLAGHRPDLLSMARHVGENTKLVCLANPNNPTGAYATRNELAAFFERVPEHVLVVLDEAYFEFADGVVPDYPDGLAFLRADHPLLIIRTFSKIAGLAGLRIGYGFAREDVAATLHKVREPFNTSNVAQAAALAALDDAEHREATRRLVVSERAFLFEELTKREAKVHPSVANFLLVDVGREFGPLEPEFARRGVILRPMGGWGFPNAFRVSIGARAENVRFLAAFDELRAAGFLAPASGVEAAGAAAP